MNRWKHDDPCALVDELARSLKPGLWLNLLVTDIAAAVAFQSDILGAEAMYQDDGFAIVRHGETAWMVHADTTYADHPMVARLSGAVRGAGCEIRLQGCDPDRAEDKARRQGFTVMAAAVDKPHGLREVFLVDPDGFVWVPSVPKIKSTQSVAA